jgi:tetrahydromethanopterin S-methyltransferase subunit G
VGRPMIRNILYGIAVGVIVYVAMVVTVATWA